jgi:hypothetical protein
MDADGWRPTRRICGPVVLMLMIQSISAVIHRAWDLDRWRIDERIKKSKQNSKSLSSNHIRSDKKPDPGLKIVE